jgi:hypothetical protein
LRPNKSVEILDKKATQTIGRNRLAVVVLGEQPKVVVSKTCFSRIKGLVQANVAMAAADSCISLEIAPHAQRDPDRPE